MGVLATNWLVQSSWSRTVFATSRGCTRRVFWNERIGTPRGKATLSRVEFTVDSTSQGRRPKLRNQLTHLRSAGEEEGCAVAITRLGPDTSAMPVDDPVPYRQARAHTFEIFIAMQTPERPQPLVFVFQVETNAVVADLHRALAVEDHLANGKDCGFARGGKLQGVRDETALCCSPLCAVSLRTCVLPALHLRLPFETVPDTLLRPR